MFFSPLRRLLNRPASPARKGRRATSPRPCRPLRVEQLEDRITPSNVVTDLTTSMTYSTIQAAVNAANPGDTLLASAGTYAENVTVNKSLTIEGNQHGVNAQNGRPGAMESVLDASGNGGKTPFDITANNVTIDGFTIEGVTNTNVFGFGILLGAGTAGSQIVNNIIQNNIAGLSLANNSTASQTVIQHNLFQNNNQPGPSSGDAIYTDQFNAGGTLTNVLIDSNTFTGNSDAGLDFSSTDATKPATDITISNNVFNHNARGLLAFNLTVSSITFNTFSNSTSSATADIRLFEGDKGLTITNNLLENGAGAALHISNIGTGSPNASNISFNQNSVSGYTGPSGVFVLDAGSYTGTLDATANWWGSPTGPTTPNNPGGTGQTIVDPSSQVRFSPYLTSGANQQTSGPGFVPLTSSLSGAPINGSATALTGNANSPLTNVVVATFTSGNGDIATNAFLATITWGDNTSSTGTVLALGGGSYQVQGSHTYTNIGHYTVTTQITEGSASASFSATATIHQQLLPDGTVGNATQNFVSQLYHDLLGHPVDPLGLEYWSSLFSYYENAFFTYYNSLGLDPMTSFTLSQMAAQFEVALGIEVVTSSASSYQQAVLDALFVSTPGYFNNASL